MKNHLKIERKNYRKPFINRTFLYVLCLLFVMITPSIIMLMVLISFNLI